MKLFAIISSLVFVTAFVAAEDEVSIEDTNEMSLEEFKQKFHQKPEDATIEEKEAEALAENELLIDEINEEYKEGKETFYDGLNPMSDIPKEVFDDPAAFKGTYRQCL